MIAVENDFVEGVYDKLAKVYDVLFGPILHPGRLLALERMGIAPGNRVLEVGVGTGINAALYPRHCQVTGIDFSASMLEKARERVSRKGLPHVRLMEMDAASLKFATSRSTSCTRLYLVNCVSDPVKVVSEMRRVCKPGGKIVILNHFRSANPLMSTARPRAFAADGAHRLQVGSRSPGVPGADWSQANVDRESERAAVVVARDL